MANKENLSPHIAASRYVAHDPKPQVNASLDTRNQTQSPARTPFFCLSPSQNPVLIQQRDHAACRRTDSPLKVRKTRENLRDPDLYTDVPPPCVHGAQTAVQVPEDVTAEQVDISGSTLMNGYDDECPAVCPLTPAPAPGRMQRHKSVSRRMLSRVKEGISHRSRSSQSMRSTSVSDTGLIRKLSGKSKQSSEDQSRMRSFELRRDSIDSLVDGDSTAAIPPISNQSFTECSISTDDPNDDTSIASPTRSSPLTPKGTAHTRQYSGRLLSPSPPSHLTDPTPRATLKSMAFSPGHEFSSLQATTPFVDLSVTVDQVSLDVNLAKDVWVAVEGIVRSQVVEASNMPCVQAMALRKRSMDAVIIVTQDILVSETKAAHKCIVELCSRLNIAGDRLAVLCARVQQTGTSVVNCECEQLHALQTPSLTRLFERLGIAPSTIGTIFEEHWESLPDSLQSLAESGLRKDRVQTFIVSTIPNLLVQIIDHLVQWPAHAVKIGLAFEQSIALTPRIRQNWAVQIKAEGEDNVDIFDNMIKDLRHGCVMGSISSLRMCYKPMQGCRVLEVLGQKALKDVRLGQRCSLFLKVEVPSIDISRPSIQGDTTETDSLFTELESIVGTLETNLLHVEARYRQSLLPSESVVTVRQICSIRRPNSESRWSIVDRDNLMSKPDQIRPRLAQFLMMHYPPARALRMVDRYLLQHSDSPSDAVEKIRKDLEARINAADGSRETSISLSVSFAKPSVVVTDIDCENGAMSRSATNGEELSTARPAALGLIIVTPEAESSALSPKRGIAAARAISAAKTTATITERSEQSLDHGEDSARQLWRHIRHHSLSAKQLADMSPSKLQQLEAGDENIKALRHRALSNKRSVGAETLRSWKWEERISDGGGGEAPWL